MKKSIHLSFFAIVISFFLLAACSDSSTGVSDDTPPGVPDEISYAANVQSIFTNSCATCHINNTTSGVNLTNFQSVISSVGVQYEREIVVPGNAEDSPLIDKISSNNPRFGSRMPQGRDPLSSTQIEIIRVWINDGALNN
jgi:mono/diheme cytochrome c family protein